VSYTISDTAANVQAALDTANGANASDRDTILSAATVTLTTNATVDEAAGVLSTESRGLYTIPGLSYKVEDSAGNIITALSGTDAAALDGATKIYLSTSAGISVTQGLTLTGLSNFGGYDSNQADQVAGIYNISDTYTNLQLADATLLEGASTVTSTAPGSGSTINLSMLTRGATINGSTGNDTITGTTSADSFVPGTGNDVIYINPGDSGITVATADSITGFVSGTDSLRLGLTGNGTANTGNYVEASSAVANFAAALTAANTALGTLNGTSSAAQLYAFQFDATNGYLFVDTDSDGAADQVIVLVGTDNTAIAVTDIGG